MKVIIAGGRDFHDYSVVRKAVIDSKLWNRNMEIVSGMAKGVDTLAVEFAQKNNLVLHKFYADWNAYGKGAGHIRNRQMAEFSDALIAVWDGESRGTKNMIDAAEMLGLIVYVHKVKPQPKFPNFCYQNDQY